MVGMATGLFHSDTPERQRMAELVEEGILTIIWGEKIVCYNIILREKIGMTT